HDLLALRNYGSPQKYYHPRFGTNSRLDGMQAAVLNVKLKYLSGWNEARVRAAERYKKNLARVKKITLPEPAAHSTHIYHLFVIRVDAERDRIIDALAQKEIQCGIHYPIPLHLQQAYAYLGYQEGSFPHAEAAAKKIISLPLFPEITDGQVDFVCERLANILT
ncbi:MAG: DegT/DnrJ/EryC1/StrS family aminotransferase, partial [Pseudomonadota bacterium]